MSESILNLLKRAASLHGAGDLKSCAATVAEVLALEPDNADAQHIAGLVHYGQGDLDSAAAAIQAALLFYPQNPQFHANLGTVFDAKGNDAKARYHFEKALEHDPKNAPAHNGLGILARKGLNYTVAIDHYLSAIEIDPNFAIAHSNISNVYTLSGNFEAGFNHARTAIELDAGRADAWNNLGFAETMLGHDKTANEAFRKALSLTPDFAVAHFNLAANSLRIGDYETGWQEYEWRLRLNGQNPALDPSRLDLPNLEDLAGSSVCLIAEQGMGDFLQFLRFAEILHSGGVILSASCDQRLLPLIRRLPWFDTLVPRNATLPKASYQIPMMSLARLLKVKPGAIPGEIPYVSVPATDVEKWRRTVNGAISEHKDPRVAPTNGNPLKDSPTPFTIGITWQGNPDNPVNLLRSFPVEHFESIGKLAGVHLLSLQTGSAVDELLSSATQITPLDVGAFEQQRSLQFDFQDTAAILLNVDLFITSCTVTAHLAGALGVPTWIAVSHVADWRWGLNEEVSDWYPSIRIFRQPIAGDWASVFEQMKQQLIVTRG